jgi:hypothetical protein
VHTNWLARLFHKLEYLNLKPFKALLEIFGPRTPTGASTDFRAGAAQSIKTLLDFFGPRHP